MNSFFLLFLKPFFKLKCHSDKEPSCQCRRHRFDPWVRKLPWKRKWQPTPVLLSGEFHGQRSLAWGCKESDTTERVSTQETYLRGLEIRAFGIPFSANHCNLFQALGQVQIPHLGVTTQARLLVLLSWRNLGLHAA